MTVLKFPTWLDYLQVAPQPPWWWKFELNKPEWKLKICAILIAILHYLEEKFDYGYFIIFFCFMVPRLYTKNPKSFWPKNEGVSAIFPNLDFILNYPKFLGHSNLVIVLKIYSLNFFFEIFSVNFCLHQQGVGLLVLSMFLVCVSKQNYKTWFRKNQDLFEAELGFGMI